MKKFKTTLIYTLIIFSLFSCKKNSTESKLDLQADAVGTWLVTRTLVTPNQDFTNGYSDQQTWTIAVAGETATLSTTAGTINGTWVQSTATYAYPHWYFEWEGQDPRIGSYIKIVVEIFDIDPFLATNETYFWDVYSQQYFILDSFACEGVKI